MENILVSASNLYGLCGIVISHKLNLIPEIVLLSGSMISSICYHLSEHSKHYFPGFKFINRYEKVFLNFDRIFANLSICFFGYKYYWTIMNSSNILGVSLVGIICLTLSEGLHYAKMLRVPPKIHKILFVILHIVWHLCAFHVPYAIINNHYMS